MTFSRNFASQRVLPLLVFVAACSGRSSSPVPADKRPEPVAECVAYERELARCTGVEAGVASQPAAIAKDEADRARLASLCSSNLERLRRSCR